MKIPEAIVEVGARALGGHRFDALAERSKTALRDEARGVLLAALPYLAPTGDGGLREALEELLKQRAVNGKGTVTNSQLRDLLAAHPAAPAVPQPESTTDTSVVSPVDREALVRVLHGEKHSEGCTFTNPANCDRWHEATRETAAVLAVLAGEQEQVEP